MSTDKRWDGRRGLWNKYSSEYEGRVHTADNLLLRDCGVPQYNKAGIWFEAPGKYGKFWRSFLFFAVFTVHVMQYRSAEGLFNQRRGTI